MSSNTLDQQKTAHDDFPPVVSSALCDTDPVKYRNACIMESSNIMYNGAFSLGGLLPIIPEAHHGKQKRIRKQKK